MSGGGRGGGYKVGRVRGVNVSMQALVISVEKEELFLGVWWIREMRQGLVNTLPLVNVSPKMSPRSGCNSCKSEKQGKKKI